MCGDQGTGGTNDMGPSHCLPEYLEGLLGREASGLGSAVEAWPLSVTHACVLVDVRRGVQAQKFSVQRQLRKRFQRFMASQGDFNNLLLTILRGMAREASRMVAMTQGDIEAPAAVEIDRSRFEERAADYSITAVDQFYECPLFQENGFNLAADGGRIVMAR